MLIAARTRLTVYRVLSLEHYSTVFSMVGARNRAGRFNPVGTGALYLSAEYETAIEEYHRGASRRPCVLVSADLELGSYVDLTGSLAALGDPWIAWDCDWQLARDAALAGKPVSCPSWECGRLAIAGRVAGIMFPSMQRPGGRNLAIFPEHAPTGECELKVVDPSREIRAANPPRLEFK